MTSEISPHGVSVCIPAFCRPDMLREAVASIFENELRPIEIIVSDHGFSEASQKAVASLEVPEGILLRHIPGPPTRTQSANVNALFELASFERLIILHDDDLMTPHALDLMSAAWDAEDGNVDAIYGRQYIANNAGTLDLKRTKINDHYYRKDETAGVQRSGLWAALIAQFPNDGALLRKSLAMRCRYPDEKTVGWLPVDFHFGVDYAQMSTRAFILLQEYTSIYRLSASSMGRSKRKFYDGQYGYEHLENLNGLSSEEVEAREIALERFAASAVMGYLADGKPRKAALVLRRHFFRLNKNWRVRCGLFMLVLLENLGIPAMRAAGLRGREAV